MQIPQFGFIERSFQHTGSYDNPYTQAAATARFVAPGGETFQIPLFWDGDAVWRLRFSPDALGAWSWTTHSDDAGLDGHAGAFEVTPSDRKGSIRPMAGHPYHFERQDGSRFWFLGDTAWSLYTDSAQQGHDRAAAERYLDARAAQGFNVVHSMLLQEDGWINGGGPPFAGPPLEALAGELRHEDHSRRVADARRLPVRMLLLLAVLTALCGCSATTALMDEGKQSATAGDWDAFASKFDASGNLLWAREFGTSDYDYAEGAGVDRTADHDRDQVPRGNLPANPP